MTDRKKSSELREKINKMHEENEYQSLMDQRSRARSLNVGTAFGGIIEVSMRNEFNHMWTVLQPVEAVEFIEQLAAGCGIEIAMRPKQNFTSWRGWEIGESDNVYMKGSAPWSLEGQDRQRAIESASAFAEGQFLLEKQKLEHDRLLAIEMQKVEKERSKIYPESENSPEETQEETNGGEE